MLQLEELLRNELLLSELHAFLWTDPFENGGVSDHGWSCRDHSIAVGALALRAGAEVTVRRGKCMFVQGALPDGSPPIGLGQELGLLAGHTWLSVKDVGDVDLSTRFDIAGPRWRPVESPGVIASEWIAGESTTLVVTPFPDEYDREIARASHADGDFRAIYLVMHEEPFDHGLARRGLSWSNSRVSLRLLARRMPDDLYARLAFHLEGLALGERRSLSRVSRNKAWAALAEDPALVSS